MSTQTKDLVQWIGTICFYLSLFTKSVHCAFSLRFQLLQALYHKLFVINTFLTLVVKLVSSFSSGLWGVHTEKEHCFLEGSSSLPVHGLLLLQSVPNPSQGHEDNDDPKEHHLGGNVLCRQAQLRGTGADTRHASLFLILCLFTIHCRGYSEIEKSLSWLYLF